MHAAMKETAVMTKLAMSKTNNHVLQSDGLDVVAASVYVG